MEKELGKVERTHLGLEDHGIFSFAIHFEFPGAGQAAGHYMLDYRPDDKWIGVAAAIPLLRKTLRVFGVDTWEQLPGRTAYVLREEPYGLIRGIEATGLHGAPAGTKVIFKEVFEEYND